MPSQSVVTVTVTRATARTSRAGFGTILAACYHSLPGALVRTFGSADEVSTAFSGDPNAAAINRLATVVFSQNPSVTTLKIGKRATGTLTQTVVISPIAPQGEGYVWSFEVDGRAITFIEPAAATIAQIVQGLVASSDWTTPTALDVTPTNVGPNTGVQVAAATANIVHSFEVDLGLFDLTETTTDPGIATDLTAFQGYDEDWYGLILDSQSPAETIAAATWASTRVKLHGADAYLSDVPDSGSTTDVASVLQTAQRESYTFWTEGRISAYYAAGLMSRVFAAFDPGRATWHLQPVLGVDAYGPLVVGRQTTLESKNVVHLEPFAGAQVSMQGKVASGEFIDVIRYMAYVAARARENVEGTLARQTALTGKVPYTDAGIALVTGPLQVFFDGEVAANALISAVVTAPLRAGIDPADIAERLLPDVKIAAVLAGAIHEVEVLITLSL